MRRRRSRILLGGMIVAAMGMAAWLAFHSSPENLYQGKPLNFWLQEYQPADVVVGMDPVKRENCERAIEAIGTNGLLQLVRMISAQDNNLQTSLGNVLNRYLPSRARIVPASEKRSLAVTGFQILGSKAKPAIPALATLIYRDEQLNTAGYSVQVFLAIGCVDHGAIPFLSPLLTNRSPYFRGEAAMTLSRLMPERDVAASIEKLLSDESPLAREDAAVACCNLRREEAIPGLIRNLQDTNQNVSCVSAYALGRYGKKAESALPALKQAALDPRPPMSQAAKDALAKIESPAN